MADLTFNTITRRVERGGKLLELAPRESMLLEFLMRSAGRICGRMAIVEKVWDYDFDPGTNLVDVRTFTSCGLGLSIAQSIVKHHGGSIDIASELGKTTPVTVRLPLSRAAERKVGQLVPL